MSDRPNAASAVEPAPSAVRPLVARRVTGTGVWLFAGAMVISATILFAALENHRAAITAPAIDAGSDDAGTSISAPPMITIPPEPIATPAPQPLVPTASGGVAAQTLPPTRAPSPRLQTITPQPPIALSTPTVTLPPLGPTPASGPQVVYSAPANRPANADAVSDGGASGAGKAERVDAGRFANPATTVPKGTVMQAVLESALDSTRAGLARAIVSRDVYGFDGTKVLIQRGSRLIGEYKADLAAGQHRALIQWQRLMRPDGVIINLDSPSADPLGRAGVAGKVDSHFMARFGGAILQSSLDVGSEIAASRIANATTVYAVPGIYAFQGAAQGSGQGGLLGAQNVQPTLTVKQGTSVSVFVARDLDFTSVGQ